MRTSLGVTIFGLCILSFVALSSCEPDTAVDITIDGKVPPTFSFSGPWWARDFQIVEVLPQEPGKHGPTTKRIWLITLGYDKGLRANTWPKITYGSTPPGFTQELPPAGTAPPQLEEGKVYSAQALDNALNGGAASFEVRNGTSVVLPPGGN